MSKLLAIMLFIVSGLASATCFVPSSTGNAAIDQQAQAQFYACLQNEQYQQQMLQQQQQMLQQQQQMLNQQQSSNAWQIPLLVRPVEIKPYDSLGGLQRALEIEALILKNRQQQQQIEK